MFKRREQKIVCVILSVSLFLCGCGKADPAYEPGNEIGQEQGETDLEKTDPKEYAQISEQTEEDVESDPAKNIRTVEHLKRDENFWTCVKRDAGINEDDTVETIIQKLEQCKVFEIDDIWVSLYSLEYLSLLPNLKNLMICVSDPASQIKDFTPVLELTRLEQLYIKYTPEEIDLSFLTEMETLTELRLVECRINDIVFLERMPQLKRLSLEKTSVGDFTLVSKLSGLEYLCIEEPKEEMDLSFLTEMETLTELSLTKCRLRDIAFLEGMPQLKCLSFFETSAEDPDASNLAAIGKLPKLQKLILWNCGINDVSFLSSLTELRELYLNGNSVSDLMPLAGLTRLEVLQANENKIRDISPLKGLVNLWNLELDENQIRDISALSGLSHLNRIDFSDNRISDLSPLEGKKELMYLTVSRNPCADLKAVWEVPLGTFMGDEVTEAEAKLAGDWIREQHPEITEYECSDYVEGDLNGDGRTDIAFMLDETIRDADRDVVLSDNRHLFVLLKQKNGLWKELADMPLEINNGKGGDPNCGIFLGDGYLMMRNSVRMDYGGISTHIYFYRNGKLEPAKSIIAEYHYYSSYGWDVKVTDKQQGNDTWVRYAIAEDGDRLVRVDIENSDQPSHKAFLDLDLYYMPYFVHEEKTDTNIAPVEALDGFQNRMAVDAEKADLLYEPWQKAGYELLTGIEPPEYYYIVPGTEREAGRETSDETSKEAWDGDYIYYGRLKDEEGQFYHVIHYVTQDEHKVYQLDDSTGEIQGF